MARVPSQKIDEHHHIPDSVMNGLRELGLFGLQIPLDYGGMGLTNTAYARIVEEFCIDPSIAVTLLAHQSIGLKVRNPTLRAVPFMTTSALVCNPCLP